MHLRIQPSELNNMEYYEYYYIVKDLIEYLKEKKNAEKGEQDATSNMMGGMKMPSMKIPNMKIPNMK